LSEFARTQVDRSAVRQREREHLASRKARQHLKGDHMRFNVIVLQTAALAVALLSTNAARADSSPLGLWIDHTGRGAVEIVNCGDKLCGYVAWVKDNKDAEGCGEQIIGDVKSVGGGKWDKGWIWDPDSSSKYDVELTPMGDQMRVMGYAGTKWLSETYTWKRAPADLKKCVKPGQAAADAPAAKTTANAAAPAPTPAVSKVAADVTPAAPASNPPAAAKKDEIVKKDEAKPITAEAKPEAVEAKDPAPKATDETPKSEPSKSKHAKKKDGPNSATLVARIVEAMDDDEETGTTPAKAEAKPAKKDCKMELPYLEMALSYACD
jgi:uncharacterized protein (DUF2147 family)